MDNLVTRRVNNMKVRFQSVVTKWGFAYSKAIWWQSEQGLIPKSTKRYMYQYMKDKFRRSQHDAKTKN